MLRLLKCFALALVACTPPRDPSQGWVPAPASGMSRPFLGCFSLAVGARAHAYPDMAFRIERLSLQLDSAMWASSAPKPGEPVLELPLVWRALVSASPRDPTWGRMSWRPLSDTSAAITLTAGREGQGLAFVLMLLPGSSRVTGLGTQGWSIEGARDSFVLTGTRVPCSASGA
jgi:hypothetical protein